MNGVINVYKPPGISSSLAVSKVRRALGERRIGHMGTLDPMGEGVLLMGVGKSTRLFELFLGKSKTYEASFRFGFETDTLDITGNVNEKTADIPTMSDIISQLPAFTGRMMQLPPAYSAKSVGGVRAYALARKGCAPELLPAEVTVDSFRLLGSVGENEYLFGIDCSSGTYIRSLCRDLARSLGSLATMTAIKRTRCGNFFSDGAVLPDEAEKEDVVPVERVLSDLPRLDLPESMYKKIACGVPVAADAPEGEFTLYCGGEFFGIAAAGTDGIRITVYLKEDGAK